MSACKHAEPIGADPIINKETNMELTATCQGCGWQGGVHRLTGCALPTEKECTSTIWCPQCGSAGWIYD